MRIAAFVASVVLVSLAQSAWAQAPAAPKGAAVVASEPGKAAVAATVQVTATVVAVDKATPPNRSPESESRTVVVR